MQEGAIAYQLDPRKCDRFSLTAASLFNLSKVLQESRTSVMDAVVCRLELLRRHSIMTFPRK